MVRRSYWEWTAPARFLYRTRMQAQLSFPENLHYVPGADWPPCAFTVVRAGKVVATPGYEVRRATHIGQDVLFCLSGAGAVEIDEQRFDVQPGQLVWIPNERPHAHIADAWQPWTLLWFRFDGPDPTAIRAKVFGDGPPCATIGDVAALTTWFERLFATLRGRGRNLDLLLNKLVGDFFLLVDAAHTQEPPPHVGHRLAGVLAAMRADIGQRWSTGDIAEHLGLGVSQTRRLFMRHLRETPRRWLSRERLMAAQTLMVHSDIPLAAVAATCGFCDVYHFGRQFKQTVGSSPAAWRRAELGLVTARQRKRP